jgi:tellurite resistance protein TehA-like permease
MDSRLGARLRSGVQTLFPGYFAVVMATGIISIGSKLVGYPSLANALLWLNIAAYGLLSLVFVLRLLFYFSHVVDDLRDHGRGAGFFTIVAGTCLLGTQLVVVAGRQEPARALWWIAIGFWIVIMYSFFTAVVVREQKPSLEAGINGAWLIACVATQGVSSLGSLLAPGMAAPEPVLYFTLCMYLLGAMLYLTIITLIFYRFTFLEMPVERFTPPYWINMGAVAITTLAGSMLLLARKSFPLLEMLKPFLTGFTIFFWVGATWWIPLLSILVVWRHAVRRFPFRYDPQYWGMVFPLGMYTVATARLAQATELEFLAVVPRCFIYVALTAWIVIFAAMLHSWVRVFPLPRPATPPAE